ncbi:MAG: hypothetical protein ACR2J0_04015 [Mycobacteriales bacterium]|jgi:hypothetical protein
MTLVLIVAILLMALLVPRYGADSRDGRDWQPSVPLDRSPHH